MITCFCCDACREQINFSSAGCPRVWHFKAFWLADGGEPTGAQEAVDQSFIHLPGVGIVHHAASPTPAGPFTMSNYGSGQGGEGWEAGDLQLLTVS